MLVTLLGLLLAQDSGRSLYVWKPESADARLLAFCAERKVTRLYLMVGANPGEAVRAFVRTARGAKAQVHAMHPGDVAEWLDGFPAKLDPKPILDWVESVAKEGIFDGIHLDIEPHSTASWKSDRLKLAKGYVELLRLAKSAAGKLPLSAAVPDTWDRDDLKFDGKVLIEHVQDVVDWVSVMSYHGKNVDRVLKSLAGPCAYKPGKVELIQETDPKAVEEGVPLHVGTAAKLEEIFRAARERYGEKLMLAVHHYGTWRELK